MRREYSEKIGFILLAVALIPTTLMAHPGRKDSKGGHRDNQNVSGLGSYHFHCGEYDAHLHSKGVCPYQKGTTTTHPTQTAKPSTGGSVTSYRTTVAKFNIDGKLVEIGGIVENGTTFVEMRPLCDALGIQIEWDKVTSTAHCSKDDKNFSLSVGSTKAVLNKEAILLENAPKLINNKTLLPARFVAQAVGKVVNFNSATGVIDIQ